MNHRESGSGVERDYEKTLKQGKIGKRVGTYILQCTLGPQAGGYQR